MSDAERTKQGARSLCGALFDTDILATEHDVVKSTTSYKGTAEQLLKLVSTDRDASDHFSRSVAVSSDGARVAVGCVSTICAAEFTIFFQVLYTCYNDK